jgi:hypothetical protein
VFQVSQSATGQFVVIHPPSNTVMVGDDLAATYEQMRGFVAGLGPAAQTAAAAAPPATGSRLDAATGSRLGSSATHWILLAALALLPFVWLGALHVSLGRLVAELRIAPPAGKDQPVPNVDLRARVERVERQVESLVHPGARPAEAGPESDAELQAEKDSATPEPAADGKAADGKAPEGKVVPDVKAPEPAGEVKPRPTKAGVRLPRPGGAAGPN